MEKIIIFFYFFFYIFLTYRVYISNLLQGHPSWFTSLDMLSHVYVIFVLVLYLTRRRPASLKLLFKISPFLIVLWNGFAWYYEIYPLISERSFTDGILLPTFLGLLMITPAWYFCFRFGFRKTIEDPSDKKTDAVIASSLKVIKYVTLFFLLLICGLVIKEMFFLGTPPKRPCSPIESSASSIAAALADYFSIPTHTMVTADDLKLDDIEQEWEIDVTDVNKIIIWVYEDPQTPCPKEYQDATPGWEDGVYSTTM